MEYFDPWAWVANVPSLSHSCLALAATGEARRPAMGGWWRRSGGRPQEEAVKVLGPPTHQPGLGPPTLLTLSEGSGSTPAAWGHRTDPHPHRPPAPNGSISYQAFILESKMHPSQMKEHRLSVLP